MTSTKMVRLSVEMTEEQAIKLSEIAARRDKTAQECVVDWIENDTAFLSDSVAYLEKLAWMNLYWSSLPFTEGTPKQRLNEDGLEQLWDNASAFASKFTSQK